MVRTEARVQAIQYLASLDKFRLFKLLYRDEEELDAFAAAFEKLKYPGLQIVGRKLQRKTAFGSAKQVFRLEFINCIDAFLSDFAGTRPQTDSLGLKMALRRAELKGAMKNESQWTDADDEQDAQANNADVNRQDQPTGQTPPRTNTDTGRPSKLLTELRELAHRFSRPGLRFYVRQRKSKRHATIRVEVRQGSKRESSSFTDEKQAQEFIEARAQLETKPYSEQLH
jgi:hypothetical protein